MKKYLLIITMLIVFVTMFAVVTRAAMMPLERAEAYYKQGYLYYYEKSYNKAIAEYKKALNLNPNMAKAHYWLGKCYYQIGDYPSARKYIETAIDLSPGIDDGPGLLSKTKAAEAAASRPKPKPIVRTKPIPEKPTADKPKPKSHKVSLDFRNVDIHYAISLYAKETGENIIVNKDVYGKISIQLNDVSTIEAFAAILEAGNCLSSRDKKGVITVFPKKKGSKTQYLPGGLINKTFSIEYVEPGSIKSVLTGFLSPSTKVITVPGTKSLIIEGTPEELQKAETLIQNIDVAPKQVMVEAKFIEIKHNADSNLGMNIKYTDPSNPNNVVETVGLAAPPTATTAKGLYYSIASGDIEGLLEALSTRTGYNLLASPKLLAIDGEESEIIMGSRLGYKTKTVTTTGLIEGVEFLDVGTKLVIKPSIKDDGHIIMEIHPEISEGSIVNELPQKNSTETTTKLLVKDGQTIIIGGLFRDMTQKVQRGVPFLADIPFLGLPFRRTELIIEKRELIIFITPHIVTAEMLEEMGETIADFEKRKKDEEYSSPMDLIK